MTYDTFKEQVRAALQDERNGLTWKELRIVAHLPYERACPEWTRKLESDIRLDRSKKRGNAKLWRLTSN